MSTPTRPDAATTGALVDLLGDTRGRIVELLGAEPCTVTELADAVGLSEVAVRRHLHVLEGDRLIDAEIVRRDGPGRPGARYRLTAKGRRLFPDRSAELATELLDYLEGEHGRSALHGFLKWRNDQQSQRYEPALADAGAEVAGRVARLAQLLDEDGFVASSSSDVDEDGSELFELRQDHCAIADVAEAHPELCAYEAALFQRLLGANVSRRQTIASGATACVCTVRVDANAGCCDDD